MLVFPNIKINLGLRVLNKRSDGFHSIETIFYPVGISDLLELIPAKTFSFTQTGIALPEGENLCVKAWRLLRQKFPALPEVEMYLHKLIPAGAGLGAGSSDAAHVLTAANELFQLNLTEHELLKLALQLGSDCPFFIYNKPGVGTGRGEILQKAELDLSGNWIMLIHPGVHISTAEAFSKLDTKRNIESKFADDYIIHLPQKEQWQKELVNHFEPAAFASFPQLQKIRDGLIQKGAYYAAMSGSGSTIFGLFDDEPTIDETYIANNYWVRKLKL